MIPLYESDNTDWSGLILSASAHPGLVFDKFPNGWLLKDGNITLPDGENGEKESFYTATVIKPQEHLESGLDHAVSWQAKLVTAQDGIALKLQTDWRLITGLGNSHPYETGFTWHRTLGVPYLAGSSVKGILRDWITNWSENGGAEVANRLLGHQKADEDANHQKDFVGSVIIFDALPVKPPKLEVDIVTPHYQRYYEDQENNHAGDYYNPVPIKFLTVAGGQYFQFGIAPRSPSTSSDDLKLCKELLIEALENLGAGGKTAVGYGYFLNENEKVEYTGDQALIYNMVSSYTNDDAKRYLSKHRNKAINNIIKKCNGFLKEHWIEHIKQIKNKFPDEVNEWAKCEDKNNLMFKAHKAVTMSWMPSKDKYTTSEDA